MAIDNTGNGHGGGNARLRKLIAHHQQIADEQNKIVQAMMTTLSMLEGSEIATKAERSSGVLADAIAIDTERRSKRKRPASSGRGTASARARIHEMLEQYQEGDKLPSGERLGALVLHGYIRRDENGDYIRTGKAHHLNATHAKGPKPKGTHLSTEPSDFATMSVAELMNSLAPREAVPPGALKFGKGVLMHHGYLRKKADGTYVRTAKPYRQADAEPETTT